MKIHKLTFEVEPKATPRPRRSANGGVYMPSDYQAYKHELIALAISQGFNPGKERKIIEIKAIFCFEMPKSWGGRKRTLSVESRHTQKPDLDNLVKGVMDALIEKDESVAIIEACKFWNNKNQIFITLAEAEFENL